MKKIQKLVKPVKRSNKKWQTCKESKKKIEKSEKKVTNKFLKLTKNDRLLKNMIICEKNVAKTDKPVEKSYKKL